MEYLEATQLLLFHRTRGDAKNVAAKDMRLVTKERQAHPYVVVHSTKLNTM